MFDVDGTLTPARQNATPEMIAIIKKLRGYTATAFVSGSDLPKIEDQLGKSGQSGESEILDFTDLGRAGEGVEERDGWRGSEQAL